MNRDDSAGHDPVATVADWRARGAASADPVGFGIVEALARRAAGLQGEARALLVRRVEALLAQRAEQIEPAPAPPPAHLALARLSALVDRLGRPAATPVAPVARTGTAKATPSRSHTAPLLPLKSVTEFKGTWSRLRAEQRLRQALDQVPNAAGPLNSSNVVNRALQAMHDLSPAYLDAFMSHVDTLQWLEQASGAGDLAPRTPSPPAAKRRPATRALRKA